MDPDITLVFGLFLMVLAIPSVIAALFESRLPWIGLLICGAGAAAVWYANDLKDGGYALEDVPYVIFTMIASLRDMLLS